jgi:5-methylcytosine-specific restriction endonuclease McrA
MYDLIRAWTQSTRGFGVFSTIEARKNVTCKQRCVTYPSACRPSSYSRRLLAWIDCKIDTLARGTSRPAARWSVQMKLEVLFEHWKGRCAYCGTNLKLKPDAKEKCAVPTRDHFIPLAAGGGKGNRNHVLACKTCNAQKGSLDPRVMIRVWHQLDAKSFNTFVAGLEEAKPRFGIAGRIKALLKSQSRVTKKSAKSANARVV